MRLLFILIAVLTFANCASVEELETASTCQVWENQKMIGPRSVEVKGDAAKYQGKCSLPGIMCLWVETKINPQTGRISLEGNSIFEGVREVATLDGNTIKFDKSFWESFVKSSPAEINMKKRKIDRTVTLTMMGVNKSSPETAYFNPRCSKSEVAIGVIALWAGRAKDAGS